LVIKHTNRWRIWLPSIALLRRSSKFKKVLNSYLFRNKTIETPGPCSYETGGGFDTVIKNLSSAYSLRQLDNFKPSTNFSSKVERFESKPKLSRLGPGYYKDDKVISWNAPCYANLGKHIFLKKVLDPSPASIPSHDAIFGYEMDEDGRIIKQKNTKLAFTGKKKNNL